MAIMYCRDSLIIRTSKFPVCTPLKFLSAHFQDGSPGLCLVAEMWFRMWVASLRYTHGNSLSSPYAVKYGISDAFDREIVSGEIGSKKPEHGYFRKAAKMLGVKYSQIAYFDDDKGNVEQAKKLGIRAFVFRGPDKAKQDLQSNRDKCVKCGPAP